MAKVLGDKQAEADGVVAVRQIIEVNAGRVQEAIEDQGEKELKNHREARTISSPSPATTLVKIKVLKNSIRM